MGLQVEVIKKAYLQGEVEFEEDPEEEEEIGEEEEEEEHDAASPRNVGHNIYILAHQVGLKGPSRTVHPNMGLIFLCWVICECFQPPVLCPGSCSWHVTTRNCR